jgi:hypothetical protein
VRVALSHIQGPESTKEVDLSFHDTCRLVQKYSVHVRTFELSGFSEKLAIQMSQRLLFVCFCNDILPHFAFFPVTLASTEGNGSYGKWFCL